jgi:uncharacterized membrane protein YraQ (UPF0718 family)
VTRVRTDPAITAASPRPGRPALTGLAVGIGIAAALIVLRMLTSGWEAGELPDRVRDFVTLATSVVIESLPFVFLGIFNSILVRFWVTDRWLQRIMPRTPWLRRVTISLVGVLLPVCECGNVPLARGFMMKGFSVPEAMTFLLAAPILNPVTIVTTYQAFGWDDGILAGRIVGGFVIANLVGWVFSRHPLPEALLTPRFEEACRIEASDGHASTSNATKVRSGLVAFAEETSTMLPALIVGSAIAGAIQVGLSRDLLAALGSNPIWSVLALMILAFVIAICSNVDAFFILAFGSTFLPGGIVAFLVFGAMVDVKMLTLMRTTFTTGTLVRLVLIVALASIALGFGVNLLA